MTYANPPTIFDDPWVPLPAALWHGSSKPLPDSIHAAKDNGGWWHTMDHDKFLSSLEDETDEDARHELDFEQRTSYANVVFESFCTSDDPHLRSLAETAGLEGLGDHVGILFVTSDEAYAERYGNVHEIDRAAPGLLAAIHDENVLQADCWLLVFEANSPFPLHEPSAVPAAAR